MRSSKENANKRPLPDRVSGRVHAALLRRTFFSVCQQKLQRSNATATVSETVSTHWLLSGSLVGRSHGNENVSAVSQQLNTRIEQSDTCGTEPPARGHDVKPFNPESSQLGAVARGPEVEAEVGLPVA
jgi:hypothetical protein